MATAGSFSAVSALISEQSTGILVVLLVANALAYAISPGCGYRGGPIFAAAWIRATAADLR
jgi:hypothetical protein